MTDQLDIRPYQQADEPDVVGLWRDVFSITQPWHDPRSDVERKVSRGDELLLVGLIDGVLIATIMIGYDGHRGWMYRVAVAAAQRRNGIGRAMVHAAEDRLRRLGCPKLNLQVEGGNRAVVGFYECLGYLVEDRISMGKPL